MPFFTVKQEFLRQMAERGERPFFGTISKIGTLWL